jgi:hypothetical protein
MPHVLFERWKAPVCVESPCAFHGTKDSFENEDGAGCSGIAVASAESSARGCWLSGAVLDVESGSWR